MNRCSHAKLSKLDVLPPALLASKAASFPSWPSVGSAGTFQVLNGDTKLKVALYRSPKYGQSRSKK
jgi:hypothetical protein